MKEIIVKWGRCNQKNGHMQEMRVLSSDHPRFVTGYRFDFGFLTLASNEGYTITILPPDK